MKSIYALVLALGAMTGIAPAARAATSTRVTGVVETPNAVFFQPSQFPTVIWFFPKTELEVTSSIPLPTSTTWRGAVVFKAITADDLARLPAAWTGKSFVPFLLRPTTECALTRLPEMSAVLEEVSDLNRDVSSANPPVCRFRFRLPTDMTADLQDRFAALVSSDTLVQRALNIDLAVEVSISWAEVHAAVAAVLEEPPPPDTLVASSALTLAEAQAAVEAAVASSALAAVDAALTPDERLTFVQSTVAQLFKPTKTGTTVELVATAPAGAIVYHLEPFHRAM